MQSVYISRITKDGTADKDGRLLVGDKIVSVNKFCFHCNMRVAELISRLLDS